MLEPNLPLARRLGWIQSASAGVDRLLYPGLVASDITVTNAGGVFDDAMAEYAIGCMLVFRHRTVCTGNVASTQRLQPEWRPAAPS